MDPQIIHTALQFGCKSRVPTSPPQVYNFLEQLIELRKSLTFISYYKGYIYYPLIYNTIIKVCTGLPYALWVHHSPSVSPEVH